MRNNVLYDNVSKNVVHPSGLAKSVGALNILANLSRGPFQLHFLNKVPKGNPSKFWNKCFKGLGFI